MPSRSQGLPLFLADSIREIEQAALSLAPPHALMERAGMAAAQWLRDLTHHQPCTVLVLVGTGNNGGDALHVAWHLKQWGYWVHVLMPEMPEHLPDDAAQALLQWRTAGGDVMSLLPTGVVFDWVVDGLFGIGLTRPISGKWLALIQSINQWRRPTLALDIPSGIHSGTGTVLGTAIRATHTMTFIGLKPGLLTGDGVDYSGQIRLATLWLNAAELHTPDAWAINSAVLQRFLPRAASAHKGTFGTVGIIGGAAGMLGAALLAGRSALQLGAGKVMIGLVDVHDPHLVDWQQPELMFRPLANLLGVEAVSVLVVGPGLGKSEKARQILLLALSEAVPLVLDADALNILAQFPELQRRLKERSAPTLLTPHPLEASRLLGISVSSVQQRRIAATLELVQKFGAYVVLKGAGSVCASTNGQWFINTSGNPAMASAGMGDVLAGLLGSLLAQGLSAQDALLLGVWLHGSAADYLVDEGAWKSVTASEVLQAARQVLSGKFTPQLPRVLRP